MKKSFLITLLCISQLIFLSVPVQGQKILQIPLASYTGTEELYLAGNAELNISNNVLGGERGDNPVYMISGTSTIDLTTSIGKNYIALYNTTKLYNKIQIIMDVKSADGQTGISLRSRSYSNENCSATNGPVSLMNFSATDLGEGWHTVALDLNADGSSNTYTVWLDGEVYKEGTTTAGYGLSFARIQPTCKKDTNVELYLDNIAVSYEKYVPELLGINEGDPVDYDSESFTVQLDGTMGSVLPSDIVLRCGKEETPVAAVEVRENELIVTLETELESSSDYTLTLQATAKLDDGSFISQAQTVGFSTTSRALDISAGNLIDGETVTFSGTYIDTKGETYARAIIVLYDANGRIVSVKFGKEMTAGDFSLSVENPNGYTAKAFCVTKDFQQVIGEKLF